MSIDLIIENTTLVTMNAGREILDNASLAISGNTIAAIGKAEDLRLRYPDVKRIDGRGKVTLPGLINAHTHISMSVQKGTTLAVPEGLYRVMWPLEKSLTAEDAYIGALAGGAEALKAGATTVVDHYFYMERVTQAVIEVGLRGVLGHTIMSRLGPFIGEAELEEGIDYVRRWKGKHQRVHPWLAPHASDTVAREWLLRLRETATAEGVGLHLHLAQSPRERAYIEETYGMGCVEYLADIGFLAQDVIAAHCIYIKDSELDLLAKSGAHPIYCPMGHALSGNPARAWEMLQLGAGVIIGTDCVTENNVMDIVGELRIAGASQKQLTRDERAMPASKILEMVTVDAAEALGMAGKLGELTPGALADVVMLDFDGLFAYPNYSLLDNIVYCLNGRDVHTVIVDGEVVVADHRLLKVDEAALVQEVQARGLALVKRAVEKEADLAWLWQGRG